MQSLELFFVFSGLSERHLMGIKRPFYDLPMNIFRSCPALCDCKRMYLRQALRRSAYLGSPEYHHRPARFHNGFPRACCLLNVANLRQGPFKSAVEVCIDIVHIFHDSWVVSTAREICRELLVVHTPVYRSFTDLESIDVKDG